MDLQENYHYESGGCTERKHLFFRLLEKAERQAFDDSFLELAVEYQKMDPDSERFDVFYGWYAMHHGAYNVALEAAKRAEEKRPLNFEVWKLMSKCCHALKRPMEAIPYDAMCQHFYDVPLHINVSGAQLGEALAIASRAMNEGAYPPFLMTKLVFDHGELTRTVGSYLGSFVADTEDDGRPPYWAGAYVGQSMMDYKGWLFDQHRDDPDFALMGGADCVVDMMRSRRVEGACSLEADSRHSYLLPVAGLMKGQELTFEANGWQSTAVLAKWAYNFFRIERDVELRSKEPFIMGEPIPLGHSLKRKKLILNLLMDGLCWSRMKELDYCYVPNIVKFFSKRHHFQSAFFRGGVHLSLAADDGDGHVFPSFPPVQSVYEPQAGSELSDGFGETEGAGLLLREPPEQRRRDL